MNRLPPENPYAAPQATIGAPTAAISAYAYKPLFGRALAVWICLGLFGSSAILALVTGVGAGSSGQSLLEGWNAVDEPLTRNDVLEGVEGLSVVASAIAVCFFLPQANRNCRALTGRSLRFTPASTVWWFLVPFMNLIRPYQAVKEIWQAGLADREETWFLTSAPAVMRLWWAAWIAFNVLSRVTSRTASHSADVAQVSALLERIAGVAAAACLSWVVSQIVKAQLKQAALAAATRPS